MYNSQDLSIIIAAYNEENNILGTVKRVRKAAKDAEIIVVDDGSKDATSKMAGSIKSLKIRVISYKKNRGKGYAVRVGIGKAKRPIHVQIDADSQFLAEEIPLLIKPILDKRADIVFGTRFRKGASIEDGSLTKSRWFANQVVSGITSILSWTRLTDVNAGFKAWTAKSIRDIGLKCDHFGYEPEIAILAHKKGYKIVEVPITYTARNKGTTSVNLIRDGIRIPLFLLKTKFFR
jgi:dolichol-phosphate mannosyltransferase